MAKLHSIACFIVLILLFSTGCEPEQAIKKGKIEFAFESSSANAKVKTDSETLRFILITVKNQSGETVYSRKKIELFKFGENYISEPVEFLAGQYSLTEFFVINDAGVVSYAVPLEESRLAYLVSLPLPINFNITEDQTNKITPQVVATDGFSAEDFGYTTFSFDILKTISFQLAVFIYNAAIENFELTTSHVSVTANNDSLYDQNLTDSTQRIIVKDGYETYNIQVSKSGYQPYHYSFSRDSLSLYHSGSVLKIILIKKDSSVMDGLVGYYPFNGNANDESPDYNNHGVVHGPTLTTDRKGNANSAYNFDGINDYISIQDDSATDFEASQDFTVSVWAWVNSQQMDNTRTIFDIIRKWDGYNWNGYPYSISYLNQNASMPNRFLLVRYDGQTCGNIPSLYSPVIANPNSWHHIVMIKKGDIMKFYLNGSLVAEVEDTSTCQTSNNIHITIGSRGNIVQFFTGKIDDVRFYNRAISESEVGTLYQE